MYNVFRTLFDILTKLILLCLVEIMSHVDLKSTKYLKQMKRQALKCQKVSLEVLRAGTSSSVVEVVPPMTTFSLFF